jgi:glycosyltransferase A (GT-A) superfamily protein (DUF2064 family)
MKLDDRCLLFFVKYPEKGKVKSRLAAVIGDDSAVSLYKNLVAQMLSTLKEGTFPLYICFFPKNAQKPIKNWLGREYRYIPQNGKDLGSDIPDLPMKYIEEAFKSLKEMDAVIGPAFDGGYYLIGFNLNTFSPQVFEGIVWGTENVFEETMRKLKRFRRVVYTLPYQRDIDTAEDLKRLKGRLSSNHP